MLGIHELWLFVLSGLLLNITPGPDTAYIIGRSMQMGWRGGAAAAFGICCGCLVHVFGRGDRSVGAADGLIDGVCDPEAGSARPICCLRAQMLLSRSGADRRRSGAGRRDAAAAGVLAGRSHQRAQSQGRAVLPRLPAAIRRTPTPRTRRSPSCSSARSSSSTARCGAWRSRLLRPRRRPVCGSPEGADRLDQPRPRRAVHLSRHSRRDAGGALAVRTDSDLSRWIRQQRTAGEIEAEQNHRRSGTSGGTRPAASVCAPSAR